jgi:hypothetical protein
MALAAGVARAYPYLCHCNPRERGGKQSREVWSLLPPPASQPHPGAGASGTVNHTHTRFSTSNAAVTANT